FLTNRRRPDRIKQNLYVDAGLGFRRKRSGKSQPDLARPIDVRLNRDRSLGLTDVLEHRRIELVAVVQEDEAVAGCERHASGAHDGLYELVVRDRELVIESVARRKLARRNQIADKAHQSGDDRPIPPVGGQREHAERGPRPPRPEQLSSHRPKRQPPLWRTGSRPQPLWPLPWGRRL